MADVTFKRVFLWFLMLLSVCLYVSTLIVAYGGYYDPMRFTLPSMGLLFFPYFAIATLVVSAAWLIGRKYVVGVAGVCILLACGPTFLQSVPFRFPSEPSNPDNTFKMISFNCLHLRDSRQENPPYNRSLRFLTNSGADFICLQEFYSFDSGEVAVKYKSQVDSLLKVYPYYSKDTNREVEFLSKYPFETLSIELGKDVKIGSCGIYRLKIDGRELTVINVHLPSYLLSSDERKIFTEAKNRRGVKRSIKELEGSVYQKMKTAFATRATVSKAIADYAKTLNGNVILCGDFNDVPGSWAYRNFTTTGFEDAYAQTGFGHLITYNEHLMFFHIDQILYKGDLVPLHVTKDRLNASDHYPLIAEFEFI